MQSRAVMCYAASGVSVADVCQQLPTAALDAAPGNPCTRYIACMHSHTPAGCLHQVPRTYFPMRPGNRVTLYHDSTCVPGPVEGIRLAGGGLFSESSCWDDIYDAIMEADR
jgi:hypothetical protein